MHISIADTEANGFLHNVTKAHCGVFINDITGEITKFRNNQIPEMLAFMDTIDVLVMHNELGYDLPMLKKLYNYDFKGKKVDTLVMSRILYPKLQVPIHCPNKKCGPHSIEAWGWRIGRGKPEHNDWEEFSEEMLHRCTEDAEILRLVYHKLLDDAKGKGWKNAFLLSFKLFENLQKQEEYGWLVDREHMDFCIHQLDHWINRIDKALQKHLPLILEIEELKLNGEYKYVKKPYLQSGKHSESVSKWYASTGIDADSVTVGGPFSRINFRRTDLNSNLETKDFLLNLGWEPLEWNYNDDNERTSPKLSKDDPFEGVNSKLGSLVVKRVQAKQRRGIIEGLVELIRPDGRIASRVNTIAVTGRATHRNIVNIPAAKSFFGRQMRKIFICLKDKILVSTDSDACQIRMLCGRMNDPVYTDNVLNGRKEDGSDIHSVNMRAAGLGSRDDAKTFFYGFLFGAGDAKIGKIIRGTSADGKRLKTQFLAGLPALKAILDKLINDWRKTARSKFNAKFNRIEQFDGYITGLDGRPILVPSEHQILVYLLQSDEAIMMAAAYNRFHKRMNQLGYTYGKEYGTVCWYHDEFTIECNPDIADIVAKESEDSIKWAGEFYKIPCPHLGQAKIGDSWFAVH